MKRFVVFILSLTIISSFTLVQPVFAKVQRNQTIILKFDDFGDTGVSKFQRIIDVTKELGAKCSVGVIGSWVDRGTPDSVYDVMRQWYSEGVEIWHHGYHHSKEEYSSNSYEQQKEDFERTMNLLKDKCGITLTTFGSPYNNSGETTRRVIQENFPEIKTVLYTSDPTNSNPDAVYLSNYVKFESKTGVCSKFEEFVEAYEQCRRYEYLVLQAHPGMWTDESFDEYEKIINYLKEDGCVFKTPSEYTMGHLADLANNIVREKVLEVRINKKFIDFDVAGEVVDGVVMIPFRSVFENLGAEVSYDDVTGIATASVDGKSLSVAEGIREVTVNGIKADAEIAPVVREGRFLIPLSLVGDTTGYYIYWN